MIIHQTTIATNDGAASELLSFYVQQYLFYLYIYERFYQ